VKRTLPRRSLAVGAAVALLAAAAVVVYAFARSNRYEAEAAVEVTPIPARDETFRGFSILRVDRDPVETAAQLVETQPVAEAVAVRLGLESGEEAMGAVNAEAAAEGSVVHVGAKASTGIEAARLANAFADELVRQRSSLFQSELQRTIQSLQAQLASVPATRRDQPPASDVARRLAELRTYEGRGDPTLRIAATATAPTETDRGPLSILAIGLPIALLLGGATALLHAALRRPAPDTTPAYDTADRPPVEQLEQERRLKERIEAVTARELELARRAAQVTRRERELDEPEQPPEREQEPEPEPQPVPPAPPSLGRNLITLEHAVSEREWELSPGRREELHSYLAYLRPYAEPDGTLPSSFDPLVDEVFADLLRP
jgi:capsular polysaccharide biosynthesis protein